MPTRSPYVILVGFGRSDFASRVIEELRAAGVDARRVRATDDLPRSLTGGERVTVLVDCRKSESQAHDALEYARARFARVETIVLVDESDFCQYYRLMEAGARGYFSSVETPATIARGVRLIANIPA